MPSYTIVLFQGYDWRCGDAIAKVSIPDKNKVVTATLSYTVQGFWRTGLSSVIVNGQLVKDYPEPTMPWEDVWKGSDTIDVKNFLVSGENVFQFVMYYQAVYCALVGSGQLDAILYVITTEEMPVSQIGVVYSDASFILFVIIIILLVVVLMR